MIRRVQHVTGNFATSQPYISLLGVMNGKSIWAMSDKCSTDWEKHVWLQMQQNVNWRWKVWKLFSHTWPNGKISVSSDEVAAILNLGPAITKRGVRAIMGLASCPVIVHTYQTSLNQYAWFNWTAAQRDEIKWLPGHTAALAAIKRHLTSKPLCDAPNPHKPFVIQTYATAISVAAIITERDEDGHQHVYAMCRAKLLSHEQRYSSTECERLGITFAVLKSEPWLCGLKTEVQTDQRSLQWLNSNANHNASLARWVIILQNWDITTQYGHCKDHGHADSLSRVETD